MENILLLGWVVRVLNKDCGREVFIVVYLLVRAVWRSLKNGLLYKEFFGGGDLSKLLRESLNREFLIKLLFLLSGVIGVIGWVRIVVGVDDRGW